jgi:UDP-glucose 4-epimerase
MKYLVTGGAGFIGSHLVDRLLLDGHDVVVLDDFSTGRKSNLSQHEQNSGLKVVTGSIMDEAIVNSLVQYCDRVLHFAAAVGVFTIMEKPLESLDTNVHGTRNVLQACLKFNKPVMIASSSEVYGKNTSDLLSEDSDRIIGAPQKVRWSYSDAKALDEAMAISLHQKHGLETRIVRLFNTVGPRQVGRYGMVVPRFVEAALTGSSLTVYGSGKQTRCFGHVSDITAAILMIDNNHEAIGIPVNVGVSQEISIMNLAKTIIDQTNSSSSIELLDYQSAYPTGYEDMERRVPDNSLLKRLTGWKSENSIHNIIEDISGYLRETSILPD